MPVAHTNPNGSDFPPQDLERHLIGVSDAAKAFAEVFGAAEWGRIAGLWHDLGKYSKAFQDYILAADGRDTHSTEIRGRVDHATAGAQHASRRLGVPGQIIAYAIAGHHSGLLDGYADHACMHSRLNKSVPPWSAPEYIVAAKQYPSLPPLIQTAAQDPARTAFTLSFFTRMLYSCLVDADFLDTESFMSPVRAASRPIFPHDILEQMSLMLDRHVAQFEDVSQVDVARGQIRQACLLAAQNSPGLFSLTVPTGGGKTLSSLAFALRHARLHGLRRIVYVVPFTSIIEQNASVFRGVMQPIVDAGGADPILEHHSNVDVEAVTTAGRLATENWDAPLVVTTTVQFYESLFANRSSRCRKLHNLAESVIILDEAQTVPVDLLQPILSAINELSTCYRTSVVLCTATQPAIRFRDDFPIGLRDIREITPDPEALFATLERVEVHSLGKLGDEDLRSQLLSQHQVLCIVNTRSHAHQLVANMPQDESIFHLSARMCPAHRSSVLTDIQGRLACDEACIVVSTQLVEAGVDIDFPIVYRAMAGLDSLAQAAGRCNRNGRGKHLGVFNIFQSEHFRSERFFAETADVAKQVLDLYDCPLGLAAVDHYFRQYFWEQGDRWDAKRVLDAFACDRANDDMPFLFDFRKAAKAFHLMEQSSCNVFVPWQDKGKELCESLRGGPQLPARKLLQQLQRYSVNLPERTWRQHVDRNIELVHDNFAVLVCPEVHYSKRFGLNLDGSLGDFGF